MVGTPNWVGLENFITIFKKDREIWHSLKITLIYVAIAVPLKLAFALFIACLLYTSRAEAGDRDQYYEGFLKLGNRHGGGLSEWKQGPPFHRRIH